MWIYLVLIYGLLKGGRDLTKKLALRDSSPVEVLVVYSFLALLMVLPLSGDAFFTAPKYVLIIALKSFCIFIAWLCSFNAIKHLPVSIVGILDLSRVLFATLLAVIFLNEHLSINQLIGLGLVSFGLLSLKMFGSSEKGKKEDIKTFYVLITVFSTSLNAVSGLIDKILMRSITSSQLQFWYLFLLVIYYLIYMLIKKERISMKTFKNKWIWIMAFLFALADKLLFIANSDPASRISVMTLVKQAACIVTIIGGKLIFNEVNIIKKLICASIVILGIVIAAI